MSEYSNKIQPVQPVEKTHMSTYSYPVFNQEKKKRKQSENSISFKELLDEELRKQQERCEEVVRPQPVTTKSTLRYNMIDLLDLEK